MWIIANAACRAHESTRPPNRFKVGSTRRFAGKHPLKLKQQLGLANFHDDNTLPIVVWCVNRISKFDLTPLRAGQADPTAGSVKRKGKIREP